MIDRLRDHWRKPTGPPRFHHEPHLELMAKWVLRRAPVAVAVAVVVPLTEEDPRPCVYLPTLIELFFRDQSPVQALCSLLAMCWFWPAGCVAEDKDLLGSALLSLRQLLKEKLAHLMEDMATCLACQKGHDGDKRLVTTVGVDRSGRL